MIEESAVVISRDGNMAEVRAVRRSACGGCGARDACGTSLLEVSLGRRPMQMHVINGIDAQVGEQVIVGVPEDALLRAAVSAYLAPLVGLMVGAIGAHEFAGVSGLMPPEGASLLGALIGFVSTFRWLQGYSARLAANPRYRPMLLRRDDGHSAAVQWT